MQDDNGSIRKKELLHRTILWLKENYLFVEGISIPRQMIYENYQSYCRHSKYSPISTATFGKIIRQQFPQITTRRLGIRGHSKYHYHGLGVKENSVYYNPDHLKNISLSSSTKAYPAMNIQHPKNRNDSVPKIELSFDIFQSSPNVDNLHSDIGKFFIMYQTHSQQIMDSIVHGSFEEMGKYLSSFWKTCPEHYTYLFDKPVLIDGVIIIDIQVYIAVYKFVLFSMNQTLPEQYLKDFMVFLGSYTTILSNVIPKTNNVLRDKKLCYGVMFKQMCLSWLRGSHLYQIIFPIFTTTDIISQILEDFQLIPLDYIIEDSLIVQQGPLHNQIKQNFYSHFEQLENLIEMDFSFDSILKWIQNIYYQNDYQAVEINSKDCFLFWSIFFSKFTQEMFISTSQTFAQVNLIFLWMQHLFYTESTVREFENFICSTRQNSHVYYYQNYIEKSVSNRQRNRDDCFNRLCKIDSNSCAFVQGLGENSYFNKLTEQSVENIRCDFIDL